MFPEVLAGAFLTAGAEEFLVELLFLTAGALLAGALDLTPSLLFWPPVFTVAPLEGLVFPEAPLFTSFALVFPVGALALEGV